MRAIAMNILLQIMSGYCPCGQPAENVSVILSGYHRSFMTKV